MGSNNSIGMGDSESRSDDTDSEGPSGYVGPAQDNDLAALLQFLLRSGDNILASASDDDSDDDFVAAASPPKSDLRLCSTKKLDKNELSMATKYASGSTHSNGTSLPLSITSMLNAREKGMYGPGGFSRGHRCQVSNSYLPNTMHMIATYPSKAFCGAYTKSGNRFLSACQDRKLRLYDGDTYELINTIQAKDVGWSILDVAYNPDETNIVYSSWSEYLYLCRTFSEPGEKQEALLLCPEQRRFAIFSLQFSHDGREILGGANDGFIYVYDLECKQRALRLKGHEDDVNTVAFADSTSCILYSGGDDGLCKVWDRRTLNESDPKPVGVLAGHRDGITFIDSRGDGRHFISNSKDQTIKLWDIRVFSNPKAQDNTRKSVSEQNWDYRWQKVPKKLYTYKRNLEGDTSLMTYRGHTVLQTLVKCHFSPESTTGQRFIYTGCAAGRVVIYDLLTGKVENVLDGHRACVRDVLWHPTKNEMVSVSWDGTIAWWNYNQEKELAWEDAESARGLDDDDEGDDTILRRSQRIAKRQLQAGQLQAESITKLRRRDSSNS